jgi:acyl-CoA dehydrogenase
MDSEGITIVRPMHVYGYDDGYTGHPELKFENVVVPKIKHYWWRRHGIQDCAGKIRPWKNTPLHENNRYGRKSSKAYD